MSVDIVSGLPADAQGRTEILVVVDRFSKMMYLLPIAVSITAEETGALFVDMVFRHHGIFATILSNRYPRFTAAFWSRLFKLLATRLMLSTTAHSETDSQTEQVNRVFGRRVVQLCYIVCVME